MEIHHINRKRSILLIILCLFIPFPNYAQSGMLLVTRNGKSNYQIVIPSSASKREQEAANILQRYIIKISRTRLPIVNDQHSVSPYEILIGRTNRHTGIDYTKIKDDGFTIKTVHGSLVITGAKDNGILNGVYGFLTNYLHCSYFGSDRQIVPSQPTIKLKSINETSNPAFAFRDVYYQVAYQGGYDAWNRLDHVTGQNSQWGLFSHSFFALVPPSQYFKDHPEYYSMINGKRQPDQLCLSNQDLPEIITKKLRALMKKEPNAEYWCIGQEDNLKFCQCDKCRALHKEYHTSSGPLLALINKVAVNFPNKKIVTLAYNATAFVPNNIKPARNVYILYSTSQFDQTGPYESNPKNKIYINNLKTWLKLTPNVFIWDYVVNFSDLMAPYPNLFTFQSNLKFFNSIGVKGVFEEGNIKPGGDFNVLKPYILSTLLWNPDADVNLLIRQFTDSYFGAASPYIRQYLSTLQNNFRKSHGNLGMYTPVKDFREEFLRPDQLKIYNLLFDQAAHAVKDHPLLLSRVNDARTSLDYALLALHDKNHRSPDTNADQLRASFTRLSAYSLKYGIKDLSEGSRPIKAFLETSKKALQ